MEVHHHAHHAKNWKEYISEFLMLFFAVFAGFLAESYLEYRTERHKEHDYLVSLMSDLKIDSADVSQKKANMIDVIKYGGKLSNVIYEDNWMDKYTDSVYIWSENMFTTEVTLQYADGTIDQLKNAGGFRLIRNNEITEKIKEYTKGRSRIIGQEEGFNQMFQQLLAARGNLMYAKVYNYNGDVLNGKTVVTLKKDILNEIYAKTGSKFLSNDKVEYFKLSNTTILYTGQLYVYLEMAKSQNKKATELIKLIQAEIN